jgi:benzoyl-CoA-dihydrodiol lyase
VPLLGVLPGTGGLTRLVDKRKVRRDVADVFCTKAEGFRLRDALKMRLVDGGWAKSKWEAEVAKRAEAVVSADPPQGETGIALQPIARTVTHEGGDEVQASTWVTLRLLAGGRHAEIVLRGPTAAPPRDHDSLHALGASSWALAAFRELDDTLLHLRHNHSQVGLVTLKTEGDAGQVLAWDTAISDLRASGSWLAREIQLHQGRVLRRLDNMAKSLFAIVLPGSCFAGTLAELLWSADRAYMLDDPDGANAIALHAVNFGTYITHNGSTRLQIRFLGEADGVGRAQAARNPIAAADAESLGLVTRSPDDIDWDDEVRIAIEERLSFSPDALTGMEQNLRFAGAETCDTKLFGRLSAWQNWIFQRPNAVGERGALTMYGDPRTPVFDFTRT